MKSIIFFAFFICFAYGRKLSIDPGLRPLSNEMIEQINSLGTTWKAGQNFEGISESIVKRLFGLRKNSKIRESMREIRHRYTDDLPESFDAREAWPNCTSLFTIRDQGNCGSCWAFAAVETMSDRRCVHKSEQVLLSTQEMVSCCSNCGAGCNGGDHFGAYSYYHKNGVVSGGLYQGEGCYPYFYPPCMHHIKGPIPTCPDTYKPTPECTKSCVAGYPKTFDQDKYYGQEPYRVSSDPKQIMKEIMTNGPVAASFLVYVDFPNYKSGVYQRTTDDCYGGHVIKLLGWGTENGVDYWLGANSWNDYWGDKGFFKIKRGSDECGIESDVVAGLPQ